MAADGSIVIDTRVDTTGIKQGGKVISSQIANIGNDLSRQISHLGSIVKKTGAVIAGAFAIGKLVSFGRECLELGSDLEEVQNVVDVTFPAMTAQVDKFAKSAAQNFGLSETMTKRFTGTFGAMAKAFGFSEKEAYNMGTALTGLAGDVASFYNISQDEAYTKLKSVFTGETESLKDLGVVMTQAALDQYALANGYGKTTAAMSEAEKVALRYAFVQQQLSAASGDFIRTSDSWANQVRILKLQVDSLKATIGQGFINLFTPIIKVINTVIGRLATLANAFKAFTELITGKKSSKGTGKAQTGFADSGIPALSDSYSDAADSADNLAGATHKVADATKEAEKAAKGYLSPLDEINKYSKFQQDGITVPDSIGGDISGDIGNVDYGNLAEGNTIIDQLNDSVSKLAELIKAEDWEGLGKYMADGINHGLERIYAAINWNNVGPKIIPFVDAFTRTFNSLVDNIDWELLGRTLGAGINTIVNTLDLLIVGIDWKSIGNKFSDGIEGIISEVDWDNLGELLGNWFMVSWDIFNGMVHNLPYEDIGKAVADALNGIFQEISFTEIGNTLATGLNGAFTSLYNFAVNFDWKQMVDNVASGISTFFTEFDWKGNGKKLNVFIAKLLDSLLEIAETTDWEAFGRGIGEFLGEIDWIGHLWVMIKAIVDAIGDLFDGLEESGTAGKIAAFIGKAFIAVKIADITGIGSLVKKLVSKIGANLISGSSISIVAEKLKKLFGSGTKDAGDLLGNLGKAADTAATGGFKKLLTAIGSSGAGIGLIAVLPIVTDLFAGFIEKLMGGNGITSQMGATIHDLAGELQQMGTLTGEQTEEVWKLVEAWETQGLTGEEMVTKLVDKFTEWGLSTDQVNAVLQDNDFWTTKTAGDMELLTAGAGELGEGFSETAGQIDLSSITMKDAMGGVRDALWELSLKSDEFGGTYQGVLMSMEDTVPASATAQEAVDMLVGQLEEAGVPTDEFIAKLQEKFPEATKAVKTSVDTHVVGARKTVESNMASAEATVDSTTSNMKTDAENNLYGVQAAAEDSASGANEATVLSWGNSAREVTLKVREMKLAASTELSNMTETVRSYSESMYNIMTNKWEYMASRIGTIISDMNSIDIGPRLNSTVNIIDDCWQRAANHTAQIWDQISWTISDSIANIGNNIRRQMNSVISTVNYGISNINFSISGIESAMNFGPWKIPTVNGYRTIGFHASFPRVSKVPYLASGAVIPPRSEFLAVLGDQKHGNNIEAPEGLLRKIVREESGGKQAGGTYRFVAQMNRRTFFDEMIEEAKVRRDLNGANPFSLT